MIPLLLLSVACTGDREPATDLAWPMALHTWPDDHRHAAILAPGADGRVQVRDAPNRFYSGLVGLDGAFAFTHGNTPYLEYPDGTVEVLPEIPWFDPTGEFEPRKVSRRWLVGTYAEGSDVWDLVTLDRKTGEWFREAQGTFCPLGGFPEYLPDEGRLVVSCGGWGQAPVLYEPRNGEVVDLPMDVYMQTFDGAHIGIDDAGGGQIVAADLDNEQIVGSWPVPSAPEGYDFRLGDVRVAGDRLLMPTFVGGAYGPTYSTRFDGSELRPEFFLGGYFGVGVASVSPDGRHVVVDAVIDVTGIRDVWLFDMEERDLRLLVGQTSGPEVVWLDPDFRLPEE